MRTKRIQIHDIDVGPLVYLRMILSVIISFQHQCCESIIITFNSQPRPAPRIPNIPTAAYIAIYTADVF